MKKILLYFTFIFFIQHNLQAQTPQWVYDGTSNAPNDRSHAIASDASGNIYVASAAEDTKMLSVSKLNSQGTLLWSDLVGATDDITNNSTVAVNVAGIIILNGRLFIAIDSQTNTTGYQTLAVFEYNPTSGAVVSAIQYEHANTSHSVKDFKVGKGGTTLLLLAEEVLLTIDPSDLSIMQQWQSGVDPALPFTTSSIATYQGGSSSPDFFGSQANPTAADMPFFTGSPLANTKAPTDATNYTFPKEKEFTFGETILTDYGPDPIEMTSSTTPWTGATSIRFRSVVETTEGLFVYFTEALGGNSQHGIAKMSKNDDYTVEWGKYWRQGGNDPGGLLADENSNVYIYTWDQIYYLNSTALDMLASKFTKDGTYLWSKIYGAGTGGGNEVLWQAGAVAIDQTNQEIALSLYTDSFNGGLPSSLLFKTNYDGNIQNYTFLSVPGAQRVPKGTALDGNGNAYVVYDYNTGGGKAGVFKVDMATVFLGPTIASSTPADGATAVATDGNIEITFSENIVFGTGSIQVIDVTDGSNSFTIDAASPGTQASISGKVLTINPSSDLDDSSNYAIQIAATAIDDTNGKDFAGITNNTTLDFTTADETAPTVTDVSSSFPSGSYNAGVNLFIVVNFSEVVTVTGTPQIELETGTADRTVNYTGGSGTTQLTFTYIVQAGDESADLDYKASNSLTLNGGTIVDGGGNAATLTLATPGAANSLGDNKDLVIDTTIPTVTSVSATTADGSYKAADVIAVTVTFSENVTVMGTPQLQLETGTTDRTVNYASGSGTSILTFNYTVQAGDESADLAYTGTSALTLNGGTINDAASNAATLTLATVGATNSLSNNKALVIDTTNPTLSSSSPADDATDVSISGDITLTFSEDIQLGTGGIQIIDVTDSSNNFVIDAGNPGSQASVSGNVLTLNPASDLDLNSNYAVVLGADAIDDLAGNSFAGILNVATLNFTTINQISSSVNDPSIAEGASGSTTLQFTVSLNNPAPAGGATIDYATSNGTATAGSDYTAASGTLSFSAGETSKTIDVTVSGEMMVEVDETVIITLSNPTGTSVIIGDTTGTGTITNDDTTTVTIADINANENSGKQDIVATLSNPVQGGFTFEVFTTDGTAKRSENDYTSTFGTVNRPKFTFAGTAGETQTLQLLFGGKADTKVEADETFTIGMDRLANTALSATNIDISSVATFTILNDDTAYISIENASGNEDDGNITLTATLDNPVDGGFKVNIVFTDGTATTADNDYTTASPVVLTFAGTAGETQTFTVTPTVDTKSEPDEFLYIGLSNLIANTVTSSDVSTSDGATVTILDDDIIPSVITFADLGKTYGDASFNLGATSNSTGTISYSIVGAANGTSLSGTNNATVALGNTGAVTLRATLPADGNYGAQTKDVTLTIDKATLTATADNTSRKYGDANPAFTISYTGFKGSDSVTDIDTAPIASSTASTTTDVGTVDITLTAGADTNYAITTVKGSLTIDKATLIVTAKNTTVEYGDNFSIDFEYGAFKNGEDASVLDTGAYVYIVGTAPYKAGTYPIVPDAVSDNNYTPSYVNGTLTVTKASLTATADDKSKEYGEANPAFTVSYTGFKGSDSITDIDTAPTASSTATATTDVGSAVITTSAGTDNNYTIVPVNGTLTIGKATLTATADDKSKEYGEANPAFTVSYTGFKGADSATDLDTAPTASSTATATTDVGTAVITTSAGTDNNYTIVPVNGTLTIGKATLVATADDKEKVFGEANPTFTISYDGFKGSDSVTDLDTAPIASSTANTTTAAGVVVIDMSVGTDNNYTIVSVNGVLTILADADGDGDPDTTDPDDDNDGILDADDNSQFTPNPDQKDTDGNGVADVDEDCDNDGIINYYDTDVADCQEPILKKKSYGFSPNGDGINDGWVVEDIELFPNNVVQIFNRSGKLVFKKKGYDNTFEGTFKGKKLPVGPYIYIIDLGNGSQPTRGWIYINY